MRLPLFQTGIVLLALTATNAQAQNRFRGMDSNNDGVITRAEWRGNAQSFRNHDWNGDGVLSGDEVRAGSQRQADRQPNRGQDWNRDGVVNNEDVQIAQRYRGYDLDADGRVTSREWPGARGLFDRLDANRDGSLTMEEYMRGAGYRLDSLGGPVNSFGVIDANRDGWITRSEWRMAPNDFGRIDRNRDNRISHFEFEDAASSGSVYGSDHSNAWRRGYDRGVLEGRAAGREDYMRIRRWDLEGQRELVGADSGYNSSFGSLNDYRNGYREGFRMAYREGFDSARNNR